MTNTKVKINWDKVLTIVAVGLLLFIVAMAVSSILRKIFGRDDEIDQLRADTDAKVNKLRTDCATAFKAVCEENRATIKAITAAVETKMLMDPDRLPKGKAGFGQTDPLPTPFAL
jgi:hypothetical protein